MKKGCTKFQKWLEKKGYVKPKEANANLQKDTSNNVMHVHTDFTDFDTCVDYIKEKQTNKSKKGAKRSTDILEIIHLDICCLNIDMYGLKYFISFIGDYSRYMYIYLLHNKNEALDAFKVFKAEVEKQCRKQIKIVRTYKSGEYYGRYTEDGQTPGLLVKFLQEHGTISQYTKPGSSNQNGVAEKRN
ncbi:Retrovirus-related Pol polyprotein from transposon TNT 1-94 [Vitis vinifera]|uniref:Retrovirus-related Pol polyprotein from transposon TNT 1-94 n=1 Tax=Vitis vinifera TaxID=29760 RepID=A0A438FG85_VITVI|nr:Retrovirus-related Pol polyprotein from transposon TNT 1-94 [Vitis vinifera]